MMQMGRAALFRLKALMELPQELSDGPGLNVTKGILELKDVSFQYPDRDLVLSGVSFRFQRGALNFIVGPSGCGKSTLLHILCGFDRLLSGKVELDGQDIHSVPPPRLRSVLAVVPQEPDLFPVDIYENIRLGKPDATEDEVVQAAQEAGAHDFITALPDGYRTVVSGTGDNLSVGQRQRIALARALLRNAPVLLMDEPTAHVDEPTAAAIMENVRKRATTQTIVIVTHSTHHIQEEERVLVLKAPEEGAVEELNEEANR